MLYILIEKNEAKKMANSPLQPPTLATFRSWGIQQELVICRHKSSNFILRTQFLKEKNSKKYYLRYQINI